MVLLSCFHKLCCYLPSITVWLIAARDALSAGRAVSILGGNACMSLAIRSNQPEIVFVLKATTLLGKEPSFITLKLFF
jgi:hypothetical protein